MSAGNTIFHTGNARKCPSSCHATSTPDTSSSSDESDRRRRRRLRREERHFRRRRRILMQQRNPNFRLQPEDERKREDLSESLSERLLPPPPPTFHPHHSNREWRRPNSPGVPDEELSSLLQRFLDDHRETTESQVNQAPDFNMAAQGSGYGPAPETSPLNEPVFSPASSSGSGTTGIDSGYDGATGNPLSPWPPTPQDCFGFAEAAPESRTFVKDATTSGAPGNLMNATQEDISQMVDQVLKTMGSNSAEDVNELCASFQASASSLLGDHADLENMEEV